MAHDTDQQQVEHPAWCIKGNVCRVDNIHHSKPLTVVTSDAYDLLRIWLERAWSLDQPSIVLEITTSGEVSYSYMPLGQARVLVHQVRRLLDASKGGAR